MTLITAISTNDRIVVMSDGMAVDNKTGEITDVPKIFELSSNCAVLISGQGLENIHQFMNIAQFNIKHFGYSTINEIDIYLQSLAKSRLWAENEKSLLHLMMAGYNGNDPIIRVLRNDGTFDGFDVRMYSMGSWEGSTTYLHEALGDRQGPEMINHKEAEKTAMRLLLKGEEAVPKEIGGQEAMWHIFPNRIKIIPKAYTTRLRNKISKSV